jgi:long-chain fatty acid transport protein
MPSKVRNRIFRGVATLVLSAVSIGVAHATDGYFQQGFSTREKSLGGAGAADSADAMSIANNPAGLVDVGSQLNIGIGLFMPFLTYNASGTALVAPGQVQSGKSAFPLPNIGYSYQIDGESAWGVALYANGGFGTTYSTMAAAPLCGLLKPGSYGVYCGGPNTGVTLDQAIVSPGYAHRFGSVSVGIAPMFALQMFEGFGLGALSGFSGAPNNVSERGMDYSVGMGVRMGVEWRATELLRFALTGATPIWSTGFSRYRGLFADNGQLNLPGQIGAGVAYDFLPTLTGMIDYKRFFFGGQASIANSAASLGLIPLGDNGAAGFGWRDVNILAVGAEWRYTPNLRLRAGLNFCNSPITSGNVTLNILAPAVITQQYTAGFGYDIDAHSTVEFSALVAPRVHVSGPERTIAGAATPGSNITLSAEEFEATLSYTYKFGVEPPKVVAAKY